METWYHCNQYPFSWGFASIDGTVTKAPKEQSWLVGKKLLEIRNFFITNNIQVFKV